MKGVHDVPIAKIISRYNKSIQNGKTVAPIIDRLYGYDNSIDDEDARPLFHFSNGKRATQYTTDIPEWALTMFK